jgi:hypothetical protein
MIRLIIYIACAVLSMWAYQDKCGFDNPKEEEV